MKLGVENKRNVVLLSVLGLGALYGVYSNFSDSSSGSSPSATQGYGRGAAYHRIAG